MFKKKKTYVPLPRVTSDLDLKKTAEELLSSEDPYEYHMGAATLTTLSGEPQPKVTIEYRPGDKDCRRESFKDEKTAKKNRRHKKSIKANNGFYRNPPKGDPYHQPDKKVGATVKDPAYGGKKPS